MLNNNEQIPLSIFFYFYRANFLYLILKIGKSQMFFRHCFLPDLAKLAKPLYCKNAPQLFTAIKIAVDKEKKPRMFWLTGSQKFHLMANITETLAGRIAILDLLGLSQAEIHNRADNVIPFLPTLDWLVHARQFVAGPKTLAAIFKHI